MKFDTLGNAVWQITWGQNGDFARGVKVAGDGSVYVAGGTFVRGAGESDALLVKVTADGAFVWARTWGTTGDFGTGFTWAHGVGAGPDGSVYITGNSSGNGVDETVMLVKVDATGSIVWERLSGPSFASGNDVAVAADGTVYVVGNAEDGFGSIDALVIKFLASGRAREARTWGGAEQDTAASVAVAAAGSLAVGGAAGAPPYTFRRAQPRTRQPNGFVIMPAATVTSPTDPVATALGLVMMPNGSLTFRGAIDAAFLRLAP